MNRRGFFAAIAATVASAACPDRDATASVVTQSKAHTTNPYANVYYETFHCFIPGNIYPLQDK